MPNDDAHPFPLSEVLLSEWDAIRGDEAARRLRTGMEYLVVDADGKLNVPSEQSKLRLIYSLAHNQNFSALCLSGGGIRSASFSLGIIQALAEKGLLQRFDYLSTVSGGGYIGAWLSARLHHTRDADQVVAELCSRRVDSDREAKPIEHLRAYSSYLTPKVGLLSADTWVALAILLRNMALNWLILVPLICLPVILVKVVAAIVHTGRLGYAQWWSTAVAGVCCLLLALGIFYQLYRLYTRREINDAAKEQKWFLWFSVLPVTIAGAGVVWLANQKLEHQGLTLADALRASLGIGLYPLNGSSIWHGWSSMAALGFFLYGLTALAASPLERRICQCVKDARCNILAWAASGLLWGSLMWVGVRLYWFLPLPFDRQVLLVVFGLPWLLLAMRIGQLVYIGGRSYSKHSDFEREWLGRAAGWFLIVALAWTILSSLIFFGTALYQYSTVTTKWITAGITGTSGILTAFLGNSSLTPARGPATDWKSIAASIGLCIAGPVFAATLLMLLSALFDWVVSGVPFSQSAIFGAEQISANYWSEWKWTGSSLTVLLGVMIAADCFINVNRFSLHALYRNRLIRAFLGGAHYPCRRPDGFTGFDEYDNLRVSNLWPSERNLHQDANWRPFHVINMTLNLASTRHLAWQQRKGISFTVTPKFCGAAGDEFGYRLTQEYGDPGGGISLGTAMAISGAAVSPNMGYYSLPSIAFLLTFFNVRLGWWLGNPGAAGDLCKFGAPLWFRNLWQSAATVIRRPVQERMPLWFRNLWRSAGTVIRRLVQERMPRAPYQQDAPRLALRPFLSELFGLTNEASRFVYLSDGGHFENFGLYEMVRRRCRWIIVCDGAQDRDRKYEDFGNAVRKIWIDLGVRISFEDLPLLQANKETKPADLPYFALGTIEYVSDIGGGGPKPPCGHILYIKPVVRGDEAAADVIAYQRLNPHFPQQSTVDQWFDEPQLESYRKLGYLIMTRIVQASMISSSTDNHLEELFTNLNWIDPTDLRTKPSSSHFYF